MKIKEIIGTGLTLSNLIRVTGIKNVIDGSSEEDLITEHALAEALASIVLAGGNPGEIYNVRTYGAVPNVTIPASGATVGGTSQTTAFNTALAAVPDNAILFIGSGNWLSATALTAFTSKRIHFLQLGNVYTNGASFLTVNAPGGADRQHTINILGSIIGRVNIPTHSKTTYDASTGPVFSTFTGAGITIGNNVNSMHVRVNKIEGFQAGIDMVMTGINGSQENTFAIQKLTQNRYGIRLRSTDGQSWCDKNHFTGFDGGSVRISGEVALKIDGDVGSTYNGAFRSNKFQFLAESVTRMCEINGDVTENKLDITIEGGTNTGVFDPSNAIQCRSISPNFLRSPKWCGQGVLATNWMVNGMGIDGTIDMPIWVGPGSTAYVGNRAAIDSSGNIIVEVRRSLSQTIRDALPANFRTTTNNSIAKKRVTTSAGSYTAGTEDYVIDCNAASGVVTINLPSAANNTERIIIIRNITAGSSTVSVSGGDPDGNNTLAAAFHGIIYEAVASAWRITSKW